MTPPLTPRQHEVAQLAASGYSRREMSDRLGCSLETVRAHLYAIGRKLPGPGALRRRICRHIAAEQEQERQRAA